MDFIIFHLLPLPYLRHGPICCRLYHRPAWPALAAQNPLNYGRAEAKFVGLPTHARDEAKVGLKWSLSFMHIKYVDVALY